MSNSLALVDNLDNPESSIGEFGRYWRVGSLKLQVVKPTNSLHENHPTRQNSERFQWHLACLMLFVELGNLSSSREGRVTEDLVY